MELKDIMAISGKPGLYKFISQGRNAMIVENLESKLRTSAFATDKISALEDIAIFTTSEASQEEALKDVFKQIYELEKGKETISHKSSADELKAYFEKILPEYDRDRVYISDIKKLIQWYNILCRLEMLDFSEAEPEEKEAGLTGKEGGESKNAKSGEIPEVGKTESKAGAKVGKQGIKAGAKTGKAVTKAGAKAGKAVTKAKTTAAKKNQAK